MTDAFEPKSDFLRVLRERGYVHQCSDYAGLDEKAHSGELVAYIGFDCTAPSLHVGSLLQIMMLHWLQKTGGKPIALMGGGTTLVGDPSGKDESRKLLTAEQIEANKAGIKMVFTKFMRFGEGKTDAVMPAMTRATEPHEENLHPRAIRMATSFNRQWARAPRRDETSLCPLHDITQM